MSEKRIVLNCATVENLSQGFIRIIYNKHEMINLEDVKEVEKAYIELSEGEPIYSIMLTAGRSLKFSDEAQKFLANEAEITDRMHGSAIVLDNLAIRLLTNFFIKVFKPKFPTKMFKSETAALAWLEMLKENYEVSLLLKNDKKEK